MIEDEVFEEYMGRLFDSADRDVIIYSSNSDKNHSQQAPHVRHREFSRWIEGARSEWTLIEHVPNDFPFKGDTVTGSPSDFFIYAKG